jgi:hypothetical protein
MFFTNNSSVRKEQWKTCKSIYFLNFTATVNKKESLALLPHGARKASALKKLNLNPMPLLRRSRDGAIEQTRTHRLHTIFSALSHFSSFPQVLNFII